MILDALIEATEAGLVVTFARNPEAKPNLMISISRHDTTGTKVCGAVVSVADGGCEYEIATVIRDAMRGLRA